MKLLLLILFAMVSFTIPCQAQFGAFGTIFKGAKAVKDAKKAHNEVGNQKVSDLYQGVSIDTTSAEYKKAMVEAQRMMYEGNPQLKKMMELQNDTAALRKYMEEQYGGMSQEEMTKKMMKDSGIDYDSKEFQDSYSKAQKMASFSEDPVFKTIMAEQRSPTKEEAAYLNEKYGTTFEYEGMEAYNDSVGVYAHFNNGMKAMGVTNFKSITEERPVPDFGSDELKRYIQDYLSFLKKPIADREIVDSVQNYAIYDNRHADEQFKGTAKFTLYSNLELESDLTVDDYRLRRVADFAEPIDPKNIFVFKVHKGIGCRYMEYMYSKITYKQSELHDYITGRLIKEGYIDANINQKLSDEDLFKTIVKMEFQFKVEKLVKIIKNKDKFLYSNVVPAAKNVKETFNTRKIGHVTALDVSIDAEPGEYAFIIRNPEVDEYFKQMASEEKDEKWRKRPEGFDVSVLAQGAYFFTIK